MFNAFRDSGRAGLNIAGPYEFLADRQYGQADSAEAIPSAEEGRRAVKAHGLLRIDAGWLSPKAARWMRESAGAIPPGYQVVDAAPVSRIINTRLGKIGILLFPQGPEPGKGPTPGQEQTVLAAGRALRSQTVLTLGVSPWGLSGEKKFLPRAQGVFDCILGGGEGVAFAHSLPESGSGVLWLRPDSKGRAINILDILEKPNRDAQSGAADWADGLNFRASLEFLGGSYPSAPAMRRVIGDPAPGR